jgi:hypothetical protein
LHILLLPQTAKNMRKSNAPFNVLSCISMQDVN